MNAITKDYHCPIDVVECARGLASQLEVRELPLDFDPADLGWNQNVLKIAREYTNYEALSDQLREWLVEVWKDEDISCERCANEPDLHSELECLNCPHHWLGQQELSRAARAASERLYQTWLAKQALERLRGMDR
jgi:hypothetical protein